jgi:hypothetical protein
MAAVCSILDTVPGEIALADVSRLGTPGVGRIASFGFWIAIASGLWAVQLLKLLYQLV